MSMRDTFNCIIMGAAGRDFHDFQRFFRERPQFRVVAFTATQIPFIAARAFPRALAGPHYAADIPIHPEEALPALLREHAVDWVFLAYSDLRHEDVMHKASLVQSLGASFALLGPRATELVSARPVVAVVASRTGAGKSPLSLWLAQGLQARGLRVGILRHPMPYGELAAQAVQRFASLEDLERQHCTVEEREEYTPYVEAGMTIHAGVDYARVLAAAEQDADLILWDGGNNDGPFVRPDCLVCVVDALRPGHETAYYPGETNLRRADVVVLSKTGGVNAEARAALRASVAAVNPRASIVESDLKISVDDAAAIRGRRALVVEDGPTLTHGGMRYGAGTLAAKREGAAALVDPRPHAIGSIADTLRDYPPLARVLPALGYSAAQLRELAATISAAAAAGAEVLVDASPGRVSQLIELPLPAVRVRYAFEPLAGPPLLDLVLARCRAK
mgnify:CR=1 FL=1